MPRIALLFPGQGSQYVGMGAALHDSYQVVRDLYQRADDLLGYSLSELSFAGPEEQLVDTFYAQPAIFVASYAAWTVLDQNLGFQLTPVLLAGHSLGEYTALAIADSVSFDDALSLVRARAHAMREAGSQSPGGMLAVLGTTISQVIEMCDVVSSRTGAVIEVANDNCPGQQVVAGDEYALEEFARECERRELMKPTRLKVSIAPHTQLMAPALNDFNRVLERASLQPAQIPVIGNRSADILSTECDIRRELQDQLTSTVRWTESMRLLDQHQVEAAIEVGPGKALSGLLRRTNREIKRANFGDDPTDLDRIQLLLT